MTESGALLKPSSRIKPAPCDDEFPHLKGKIGEITMVNKLLCEKAERPESSSPMVWLSLPIARNFPGRHFITSGGYCRIWARLRVVGIHTSPGRTRRLKGAYGLLAPRHRRERPGKQSDRHHHHRDRGAYPARA